MGIPHLIATLEPYADHASLRGEQVVIDGPALAYHILHVCRANGLSQPSYHVLGEAVIRWLDELEKSGTTIQHIYFDGFLPSSKQQVRMERMMKSNSRLDDFFNSNPRGCPIPQPEPGEGDQAPALDVFETANPGTKPLPDPGFLVPAIIDALRSAKSYWDRFSVVPGEADAFCARHVAQHGGTVMTSDSDLLAHDLGGSGKVAFLREIHRTAEGELSCLIVDPREIYAKIGLPVSAEPWRFAYEQKNSPNASLSRLVSACSLPVVDPVDYDEFRRQYLSREDAVAVPLDKKSCHRAPLRLSRLDPRVSELIIQLGHNAAEPSIFLPTMTENPLRGTVWEPSMPTRRLAYSIVSWLMGCPPSPSVHEFRRVRQRNQKGRQLSLIAPDTLTTTIEVVVSHVYRLRRHFPRDIGHRYWIVLSLLLDVVGCEEQGKTSHALETLREGYTPSPKLGARLPWDVAHFVAQVQAGLYSLRILAQVLAPMSKECGYAFGGGIYRLQMLLWKFPPLPRFPDIPEILKILEPAAREQALEIIRSMTSAGGAPSSPKISDEARQVGKQGGSGEKPPTSARPSRATRSSDMMKQNMFSVLDVDQ